MLNLFLDLRVQNNGKTDGKISIKLIGEDLAKKYKAPVEKIIEDIITMLQELADKGFLKEC